VFASGRATRGRHIGRNYGRSLKGHRIFATSRVRTLLISSGTPNATAHFAQRHSRRSGASRERSDELIHRYLPDIRRIGSRGQVTFTITEIAGDVFRITTQAARSKVQKWEQTGLISQIGVLPNPGNRPMHLYGAIDPRLAIAMLRTTAPEEVIRNYLLFCPQCEQLVISDREIIVCPGCNHEFKLGDAPSLLELCSRG
jgi:hypothetical protein